MNEIRNTHGDSVFVQRTIGNNLPAEIKVKNKTVLPLNSFFSPLTQSVTGSTSGESYSKRHRNQVTLLKAGLEENIQ